MLFVSFNHEENDMEYQRVTRHERLLLHGWSQRRGIGMTAVFWLSGTAWPEWDADSTPVREHATMAGLCRLRS